MLVELFEWDKFDIINQSLYYSQFLSKCVRDPCYQEWSSRVIRRVRSADRFTYVHPAVGELYCMRLLNHVRDPTSFDNLN